MRSPLPVRRPNPQMNSRRNKSLRHLQKVVFEFFEAVQPHKRGKGAPAGVLTQDFNEPIVAKLGDLRLLTPTGSCRGAPAEVGMPGCPA